MEKDLVSVIVPVYNCEKIINKCFNSILNQTYTNLEIIVINDGSKDKSLEIIKRYGIKDNRIKYYNQCNKGPSEARNLGIIKSKGEFIIFIDADDSVEKEYIEELVKNMIQFNLDIIACGYVDVSKYGALKLNDFWYGNNHINKDDFIDSIFKGIGGTLWGKMYKSNIIFEKKLSIDSNIFMGEDMIFNLEYCMACENFGVINNNLYYYNRLNENSISSKINFTYYDNFIVVIKKIERLLIINNFNERYINKILGRRMQLGITTFLFRQHNKSCNYSLEEKKNNVNHMFKNIYFKKYKINFISNKFSEKLLIYLIKKECTNLAIIYSELLYYIQIVKDKIKIKFLRKEFMCEN